MSTWSPNRYQTEESYYDKIILPIIAYLTLVLSVQIKRGFLVKTRDVCNSSKEPGGYLYKVKRNDRVQALRGMQPPCSWDDRTLSKKDRGVKKLKHCPN
jgi:hypothetical protein